MDYIQGIKVQDIKAFEEFANKLDELMKQIRSYAPEAYIYATPYSLNLMSELDIIKNDRTNIDKRVSWVIVDSLDAGDW